MKCSAGIAAAATVGALGLLASTACTAEAAMPDPTPTRTYTENRIDPATGQTETAKVTEYPDITINNAPSVTVTPAPGTGGLYLRNADGSIEGLMAEADKAIFLACHPTDHRYVLVRQTTHGNGGWGAYQGYVTASATMTPSQLPC